MGGRETAEDTEGAEGRQPALATLAVTQAVRIIALASGILLAFTVALPVTVWLLFGLSRIFSRTTAGRQASRLCRERRKRKAARRWATEPRQSKSSDSSAAEGWGRMEA